MSGHEGFANQALGRRGSATVWMRGGRSDYADVAHVADRSGFELPGVELYVLPRCARWRPWAWTLLIATNNCSSSSTFKSPVTSTVTCACGNVFLTRSTRSEIRIDICSACHPFFTGSQKFVDTAGRVDKFRRRYARSTAPGTGTPSTDDASN